MGYVCCTIEYPNAWYLDKARSEDRLFTDWAAVLAAPAVLWVPTTRFCHTNAARGGGRLLRSGLAAFDAMYAPEVVGQRTLKRSPQHLPCSPTDDQAEVHVAEGIPLDLIRGIVVASVDQAKNEIVRIRYAGGDPNRFPFFVSPDFFDKRRLAALIRRGERPIEQRYIP